MKRFDGGRRPLYSQGRSPKLRPQRPTEGPPPVPLHPPGTARSRRPAQTLDKVEGRQREASRSHRRVAARHNNQPVVSHLRLHQEQDRRARRVDIMQMDSTRVNSDDSQMHPRAEFVLQQPVLVRNPPACAGVSAFAFFHSNAEEPQKVPRPRFGLVTSEPSREASVLLQQVNAQLALRSGK